MLRRWAHPIFFIFVILSLAACSLPLAEPTPGTPPTYPPPDLTQPPTYTPPGWQGDTPVPSVTPSPLPNTSILQSNFSVLTRGGRVAFFYADAARVCSQDADGTNQLCSLDDQPVQPTALTWSPTGDRLLIDDSNSGLKIWHLGGGIFPFLGAMGYASVLSPDWSPDGQSIVYATDQLGRLADKQKLYDIFIAKVDGSTPRYMTTAKAADNWYPRWSPDGQRLAYFSAPILKYPDGTTRPSTYQITLLNVADPSKPITLATDESYDLGPKSVLAWSPDGSRIAFYGRRLYVINADGSGARQVGGTDHGRVTHLTWLPDGSSLLINDHLVDAATGDWVRLSFSYDSVLAQWVFPAGSTALVPAPVANCAVGWSRLFVGATARVAGASTDLPDVVRDGPGKSFKFLTNIYPQTIVKIIDGPVCSDGMVYWKVEYARIPGGSGWTAEGDMKDYWLERVAP